MQAAQIMGGYTLGSADILRRAMGKKKREEMEKQRLIFTQGALDLHDLPKEKAGKIFDVMEKFAGYGFNKVMQQLTPNCIPNSLSKAVPSGRIYCAQVTVHRNTTDTVTKYCARQVIKGLRSYHLVSTLPPMAFDQKEMALFALVCVP